MPLPFPLAIADIDRFILVTISAAIQIHSKPIEFHTTSLSISNQLLDIII